MKDFFSKCNQIRRKLRTWSHLLKKYLMENFIFWEMEGFKRSLSNRPKPGKENISSLSLLDKLMK